MPYGGRLSKVIVQQNVYLFQQRLATLLLGCHLIRCRYTCQQTRCVEPKHLLAKTQPVDPSGKLAFLTHLLGGRLTNSRDVLM